MPEKKTSSSRKYNKPKKTTKGRAKKATYRAKKGRTA